MRRRASTRCISMKRAGQPSPTASRRPGRHAPGVPADRPGSYLLPRPCWSGTEATLDRGEQAIILLNRRGYSFAVLCRACGEKMQCENCAIALTHHKPISRRRDRCQPVRVSGSNVTIADYVETVPKRCPKCESEHLFYLGAGSQQGEERLQELFPHARIGRMDRDTIRDRCDMERLLARLHSGEINLLVGTQMIAKGHDIHGVTLVGVVGADYALGLPDFRAAERVFQLLTQVSGRAGRGELPGRVLVQTLSPRALRHPVRRRARLSRLRRAGIAISPLDALPARRHAGQYFDRATDPAKAPQWASQLGTWFQHQTFPGVRVLGPAAAPIGRIKRIHRFHLILKASSRKQLAAAVREMLAFADSAEIPRRHLTVDVDAVQLM